MSLVQLQNGVIIIKYVLIMFMNSLKIKCKQKYLIIDFIEKFESKYKNIDQINHNKIKFIHL